MTYPHSLESEKDDQRELVREPRSAKSWAEAKERCVVDYPSVEELKAKYPNGINDAALARALDEERR